MEIQQLKSINLNEAEQIVDLSVQLGYKNTTQALFERIQQLLHTTDNCIFVAKEANEIVGWIHAFIAVRVESPLFVEIAGLVVSSSFRKQNIGKGLIDAVKAWGLARQIDTLRLRCNVIRTESHQFYKHLGFVENKQQLVFETKL